MLLGCCWVLLGHHQLLGCCWALLDLLVVLLGLVAVATTDLGSDVPQLAAGKQALAELMSQ